MAGEQPTAASIELDSDHGDSPNSRSPASVVIATPPAWRVLDLSEFTDVGTVQSLITDQLAGRIDGSDAFAARVAELVVGASQEGIFFAAMSLPGEGASIDLTSVTLAVPKPSHKGTVGGGSDPVDAPEARSDTGPIDTQPGPSQNAVVLPVGLAARTESTHVVELGSPLPLVPVFCVEYAVMMPGTERVIVLTLTTIAPSNTDMLREQFADIASTLAFV